MFDAEALALPFYGQTQRIEHGFAVVRDDVREVVCFRALSAVMGKRGYAQTAGADSIILRNRDEAERWAISVARGEVTPLIVGEASQSPTYDAPRIVGQPLQGWSDRRIG